MKKVLLVLTAITLVFAVLGCSDGGGSSPTPSDTSVTYKSTDANKIDYTLVISAPAAKAAYVPNVGDSYVLTIKKGNDSYRSSGKVTGKGSSGFTLQSSVEDSASFTVVITAENEVEVYGRSIPLDNGVVLMIPAKPPEDVIEEFKLLGLLGGFNVFNSTTYAGWSIGGADGVKSKLTKDDFKDAKYLVIEDTRKDDSTLNLGGFNYHTIIVNPDAGGWINAPGNFAQSWINMDLKGTTYYVYDLSKFKTQMDAIAENDKAKLFVAADKYETTAKGYLLKGTGWGELEAGEDDKALPQGDVVYGFATKKSPF
jgi:hypothetical protein